MNKNLIRAAIVVGISLGLAGLIALAGGDGGVKRAGWPLMLVCATWAFIVNWAAFVPASIKQTERYYDLTGSLTYISMIALAVMLAPSLDARAKLVAVLIIIWAVRLGTFLFRRISRDGKDDRFDEIKNKPLRFFSAWTLQGLWVFLTAACGLAVITGQGNQPLGLFALVGFSIWVFGFAVEVIADRQKTNFKRDSSNNGKFISTGLWAWSRHPNYFGEITLWFGMAVIALPVLSGGQWLTLISPVFVFVLINYVSGVNKLEDKADEKWGDDEAYQAYKARTSKLVLRPPSI